MIDTPPLEEYLATVISDIITQKEAANISPPHAESVEILGRLQKDAREALNNMCRSKLLTFHKTLNSTSFEFTPPK